MKLHEHYLNGASVDLGFSFLLVGAVDGLEVDVGYLGGLLLVTADVDLDDFIDPIASLRPYGDSASNSLTNLVFDSLTL